jgi:hypothetical protein
VKHYGIEVCLSIININKHENCREDENIDDILDEKTGEFYK